MWPFLNPAINVVTFCLRGWLSVRFSGLCTPVRVPSAGLPVVGIVIHILSHSVEIRTFTQIKAPTSRGPHHCVYSLTCAGFHCDTVMASCALRRLDRTDPNLFQVDETGPNLFQLDKTGQNQFWLARASQNLSPSAHWTESCYCCSLLASCPRNR